MWKETEIARLFLFVSMFGWLIEFFYFFFGGGVLVVVTVSVFVLFCFGFFRMELGGG